MAAIKAGNTKNCGIATRYIVTTNTVDADTVVSYTTYGIKAVNYKGETLLVVDDISTKQIFVQALAQKLEICRVSSIHLMDIIADAIL